MDALAKFSNAIAQSPLKWTVTGGAGFIGSHLVEELLRLNQEVVVLDNLSTGNLSNLEDACRQARTPFSRLAFIDGDIRDLSAVNQACEGADVVLHQAALGSVPRSLKDPITSNEVNTGGSLNVLETVRRQGIPRLVYAASSSTYGDEPSLPKKEDRTGRPLSPYAVTKLVNELYAEVYASAYGTTSIGLRYFNVFGPRQDPNGAYAAVIPKWISAMIADREVVVNGDGKTSRDFCYVRNVVQANLLAACADLTGHEVFNVAVGGRTTLLELFEHIRSELAGVGVRYVRQVKHGPFREGDVRHSQADISKAENLLGYRPTHGVLDGLREAMGWYVGSLSGPDT